ncbi:hypothetical protein [Nocardia sp. IFM 10818]
MPEYQTVEIAICETCLYVIANGCELDEHDQAAELMWHHWGRDGWQICYACPEDCSPWFSHSSCDACDLPQGGDRHPAVAMKELAR